MQRSGSRGHLLAVPGRSQRLRLLVATAVIAGWALALPGPASAQYVTPEPPRTGPGVDRQILTEVRAPNADVSGAAGQVGIAGAAASRATSRSAGSGLPVTGGDVVGLAALGAGAIAVGTLLKRVRPYPSKT